MSRVPAMSLAGVRVQLFSPVASNRCSIHDLRFRKFVYITSSAARDLSKYTLN